MKIKDTIINKTNYSRWAIEELISESISSDIAPVYEGTKQKVDYTDYINDVEIRDDGIYIPEMYKYTVFDLEYKPMFYEKKFSKEEYNNMFYELLEENEPLAYAEYINVMQNKN